VNQPVPTTENIDIVEIRIPCKAEWVALARLSVAAVASRLHFSIDEIEDVKLAVAEACTNAIQHARGSSHIEIKCEAKPDGLRIDVRDFGRTGPAEAVEVQQEDDRIGGLGIFLIRSLMDDVAYEVSPEHGTHLTMLKRLFV
jgi:serine/threonine-protein kinase RsbW